MNLPIDFSKKFAFAFFIFTVLLLVSYQLYWIFSAGPRSPFLEPDNYEYLLFAQLAINAHSLQVSNPYLIYPYPGFFEHPGLYQLPVFLNNLLGPLGVPLFWDFRIIYLAAIAIIYFLSLFIAKRILDCTPLSKTYKYACYSLILLSYLMLQQTEVIEWRGTIFIELAVIGIFYCMCALFLQEKWKLRRSIICVSGIAFLFLFAYYMWSGWDILLILLVLPPTFLAYKYFFSAKRLKFLMIALILISIAIAIFPTYIEQGIITLTASLSSVAGTQSLNCFYNPISLAEVQCLNANDGLYTVAIDLVFSALAVRMFLYDAIFSRYKNSYGYFMFGTVCVILLILPVGMVYVRTLQIVAPFLAIGFALGITSMLARAGSGRVVGAFVLVIVLLASLQGFLTFWLTTTGLYNIVTPPGLINATSYLSQFPNSTVFTFEGWGDYLEYYGHDKVYTDTVQELYYPQIEALDTFYLANLSQTSCSIPTFANKTDYILASNNLLAYVLFVNASNSSIARNPLLTEKCGYALVYNSDGFYVFKKN